MGKLFKKIKIKNERLQTFHHIAFLDACT